MGAMPQCRKRHAKARLGERTLMVALVGQTKERRSAGGCQGSICWVSSRARHPILVFLSLSLLR